MQVRKTRTKLAIQNKDSGLAFKYSSIWDCDENSLAIEFIVAWSNLK